MSIKISVVINTFNEEHNILRAIKSVSWANEIIVCDMHSTDNTVEIAKKAKARVVYHQYTRFVEPARNFVISKASGDWILVLDADEEIPPTLAKQLLKLANNDTPASFVEIPRKNMIFGKWMKAAMWWPDYHIRFFKKGTVEWQDEIHSKPKTIGVGITLDLEEHLSIIHHHYTSVFQFIERLNRYSDIQAEELWKSDVKFKWTDLLTKPMEEFLARFFAKKGFEDGIHGLSLSLLQAMSFLVVYLKLWEKEKFKKVDVDLKELRALTKKQGSDLNYWFKYGNLSSNPLKRTIQKIKNRVTY